MTEYSIALIFEADVKKSILELSRNLKFKKSEDPLDEKSLPHCTLVKWKSDKVSDEQLTQLNKLSKPIEIIFSGITVLPARNDEKNKGFWLEISILKTDEIQELVKKIVQIVGKDAVLNEIGDLLRPHVTLNRSYDKSIVIKNITPELLRRKVLATPKLGYAGKVFKFYE